MLQSLDGEPITPVVFKAREYPIPQFGQLTQPEAESEPESESEPQTLQKETWLWQRTHRCDDPGNCELHPVACSALK